MVSGKQASTREFALLGERCYNKSIAVEAARSGLKASTSSRVPGPRTLKQEVG
jgi:hypothetical protein